MKSLRGVIAAVWLLAVLMPVSGQSPSKTDLPLLTYTELGKKVRSLKGQVVLVYFWADY
jgi:hypothetical protein